MRAARIAKSPRLQTLLAFLKERGNLGATSAEIHLRTGSVAPGTDVSELRANGYSVLCAFEKMTTTRRRVYRYTLLSSEEK